MTFTIWREKCEWHLRYVKNNESDTCQSGDNMKMTLTKVKENEIDNQKHENNTCKRKSMQKRQFEKLTKVEVQTTKVRNYQWQCAQAIDMGWTLHRHNLDEIFYDWVK